MREFMGRPITKETVSLGIGGQIHRDDGFPELPPRARVTFKAEADYANVKHKFLDNGKCEEILILTVDAGTFEVTQVTEAPPEPEQTTIDGPEDAEDDEA